MTERMPSPLSNDADATELDPFSDPSDRSADLIGQVIGGRYRVDGVVGRGGMGVVYRGEHLELGLAVAIKVLPSSYARDAETLKRFEREARTASRVRHPNVVTVFDLGRLETGEPYLVMELLVGADLEQRMLAGQLSEVASVLAILEPVAAALDALHAEGVVHRDIKPSNIFFSRGTGELETVKLVDFGLAALHSNDDSARLTRTGHVVGTAVYMAPEAARGALSGPPGDIYSLAVVAFELLTGAAPFDGQPMEVLMDKISREAPSLTEIAGRAFPPRIEAVLASALARGPGARPLRARDFVESLRAAFEAEVSRGWAPAPPSAHQEPADSGGDDGTARTPGLRSRTWIIAPALVLLVALFAGGAWYASRAAPIPVAAPTTTPTVPRSTPVVLPETLPRGELRPDEEPSPAVVATAAPLPRAPAERGRAVRAGSPPVESPPAAPARVAPTAPPVPAPPAGLVPREPSAPTPELTPESTDRTASLLRDASSAMLHGEIPRARDLYLEATHAAPRNAAAWRGLGLASERIGLAPEARRAYTRYLEIAPDARDAATVRERLERLGS